MKKIMVMLILFGFTQSALAESNPFEWGNKHFNGHGRLHLSDKKSGN